MSENKVVVKKWDGESIQKVSAQILEEYPGAEIIGIDKGPIEETVKFSIRVP